MPGTWNKRGRDRVKLAAMTAILTFALMLGYAQHKLFDLQSEVSADVGENMVWAISQAVYQSGRLYQSSTAYPQTEQTRQDSELHADLLRARFQMLDEGPQRRYMQQSGVWPDIQRAAASLEQPDVDYGELQQSLRRVGNAVMIAEREQAGAQRDAHRSLTLQVMAAVAGILLAGALLCWQLMSSLRRATVATDEVVRQHMQTRSLLEALQQERSTRLRYRDFVSLMSHQLRTPLAVIDSTAQRLKRQLNEPLQEQNILERSQRIRSSVNHLNHLIGRVLEGLRLDEGLSGSESMPALERRRCDWLAVLDDSLERFGDLLAGRDIRLDPSRGTAPLWIECDRIWCVEILCNLLSNAHKYSPLEKPIEIELRVDGEQLLCSVRDFGPGIPDKDLELIFERFYRSENTQHVAGIGLGLSIARTLAQWHEGSLTACNAAEGGAIFTLALPLLAQEPAPAAVATEQLT
ncbi:MAG: sensor histidine kinase [Pseudomonas sp.]|uniref:sensor histidine kinase n=1 Tax=Pseudomonas sp. TaxID=306 RepID=UPI003D0C30B3